MNQAMNTNEALFYAIRDVKKAAWMNGNLKLSDYDIAVEVGISPALFKAYVEGRGPVPEDLPNRLHKAFGFTIL